MVSQRLMEKIEEVVIVGAGVAGLATALGLYRNGIRCLVLESSTSLRVTGLAFMTWTNAWKALNALGIAPLLRKQHLLLQGLSVYTPESDDAGKDLSFIDHEVRCVRRKLLLEAMTNELPDGAIKFSSKVVSVGDSKYYKIVHLSDGSIIKTKVMKRNATIFAKTNGDMTQALIGCDGINSVIARSLGFKKLKFSGRFATRGCAEFDEGHGLENKYQLFIGNGIRLGLIPCDEKFVYWFLTWIPTTIAKEQEIRTPLELKKFVLKKVESFPELVKRTLEATNLDSIQSVPLHYRSPWQLWWSSISKGNVCVAGDAMHPMTPDIGQGACTSLEDAVVLARCLKVAFRGHCEEVNVSEYQRIEVALKKYGEERRWRCFFVASTALLVGIIQQTNNKLVCFIRDTLLVKYLSGLLLKSSEFDCGSLKKA